MDTNVWIVGAQVVGRISQRRRSAEKNGGGSKGIVAEAEIIGDANKQTNKQANKSRAKQLAKGKDAMRRLWTISHRQMKSNVQSMWRRSKKKKRAALFGSSKQECGSAGGSLCSKERPGRRSYNKGRRMNRYHVGRDLTSENCGARFVDPKSRSILTSRVV